MRYFDQSDIYAILSCLPKNNPVKKFESDFAHFLGLKYAIGTSFGRTALYLGLKAINAKNMEVILPTFICTVVRNAVLLSGAIPKFVDISHETLAYDVEDLKKKISTQTKAIVVTHLFGNVPYNIEQIISLGKQNGITIIEDCAHSLGAQYRGRKVGTLGDLSIFSLTKSTLNLGGGVLATNNESIFKEACNVIASEEFSLKRRIADFPLIISYGFEQMIDKLHFDRVGKSIFKWWIIKIPRLLLQIRAFILVSIKQLSSFFKVYRKNSFPQDYKDKKIQGLPYSYPIAMNPLIASMGISQLKKVDHLIKKRKGIFEMIMDRTSYSLNSIDNKTSYPAYSFMVFQFCNSNIFTIIDRCRRQGLLLRTTWPTHQQLWEGQETRNVKKMANEFATWTVNPMVTQKEINKFIYIINSLSSNKP